MSRGNIAERLALLWRARRALQHASRAAPTLSPTCCSSASSSILSYTSTHALSTYSIFAHDGCSCRSLSFAAPAADASALPSDSRPSKTRSAAYFANFQTQLHAARASNAQTGLPAGAQYRFASNAPRTAGADADADTSGSNGGAAAGGDPLAPWVAASWLSPPASYLEPQLPPTALSWLRRRGPGVPEALLQKLFRQRQVRLFDGEKVKRISPSRVLRNGDVLLLPLDAIGGSSAALASGAFANGGGDSGFGKRASRDRRLRGSSGGGAAGGGEVGEAEDAVGGELAALLALQRRPEPLLEVRMGGVAPAQQAASLAARRASRRWMERHPDNVIDTSGGTAASTRDSAGSVGSAGEADFDFDSDGTADDVNRGGGGESELQRQAAHFERAAPARGSASSAAAMAAGGAQRVALTPEGLRRCVVASTPDFVVINKPAGVVAQGTGATVDAVMRAAFPTDDLKLVHRLDRWVSGAMLLARGPDAAAWLAACFKENADALAAEDASDDETDDKDMYVTKTYLAVVQGTLEKGRRGTVRASVKVEGAWRPAVTRFRVLATARGAALLALRPLTGRKHQLRIHCARYLGAPIVGDYRQGSWYGYQDESLRRAVAVANDEGDSDADDEFEFQLERDRRRRLAAGRGDWQRSGAGRGGTEGTDDATNEDGARNDAYWDNEAPGVALTAPIHLHSWKVGIRKPRKKPAEYVAPLPLHMAALLKTMGWTLPRGATTAPRRLPARS